MSSPSSGRNTRLLIVLVFVAVAYRGWFYFRFSLTGSNKLDGYLGVALGLFICARAAANLLDMLLYSRSLQMRAATVRANISWVGLNIFTQLIGFMALFFALTRFFR